jgi:hypothetical protein
MAPQTSAFSQTVESITLTKFKELEKQRQKYEIRKAEVLKKVNQHSDNPRKRLEQLFHGVREICPSSISGGTNIHNIQYWTKQAVYDPSIPAELLEPHEKLLRSKLEIQTRKLSLADLYTRLVTEWMTATESTGGDGPDESSFEIVDRQKARLQELCDKFEEVVFQPLETSEVEIDLYINSFFTNEETTRTLESLRRRIDIDVKNLLHDSSPFRETSLRWIIRGLLSEDLLSDEKQTILREFLDNKVVLKEIGDVLNMRYSDFEKWEWQAGPGGSMSPLIHVQERERKTKRQKEKKKNFLALRHSNFFVADRR